MAQRPSHTPVRTCIGCRERTDRRRLLRVVAIDGGVRPDPQATLPGRGAWVHEGCVDLAERRQAFTRALRTAGPLDLAPLKAWLASGE